MNGGDERAITQIPCTMAPKPPSRSQEKWGEFRICHTQDGKCDLEHILPALGPGFLIGMRGLESFILSSTQKLFPKHLLCARHFNDIVANKINTVFAITGHVLRGRQMKTK